MGRTQRPIQDINDTQQSEPIIIVVPGHIGTDKIHTIHQLIEALDYISVSEKGVVIIGAETLGTGKTTPDFHHTTQKVIQEGPDSMLMTIAQKLAQDFPNGLGNQTEILQPIDVQLIARMENEEWSEQTIIAVQKDLSRQQKKSAKYMVPKTQPAKKNSHKPYNQRKK